MGFARADRQHAPPDEVARLASRFGRLLLANGADTEHVTQRIDEVARLLGHAVRRLVTAEAILVGAGDADVTGTRIGPAITAMAADMGRVCAIEGVLDELRGGSRDVVSINRSLDVIEAGKAAYPAALVVVGVAITAASLARLFGAAWPVVAAAFAAGLVSTVLRLLFARLHMNAIVAAFLVVLVSGLVAAFAVRLAPGRSPVLCLTAAGMILVPGVPLINAVRDLVSGHAGNAVVRLTLGAATVLAIGFALFLVGAITGDALPVDTGPGALPLFEDVVFSAAAAAGYATLFNVPPRAVPACIVCGLASHGLRSALGDLGVDIATGSLLGALAAGLVAQAASHVFRAPAVTFAFPGIVAMVPGSYAFRAGVGGLQLMALGSKASPALVAETFSLMLTTAIMTIAIAIGVSLALAIPFGRLAGRFHQHPQE